MDRRITKADWAVCQDTVLQNVPLGRSHAQLVVTGDESYLGLRPPTI